MKVSFSLAFQYHRTECVAPLFKLLCLHLFSSNYTIMLSIQNQSLIRTMVGEVVILFGSPKIEIIFKATLILICRIKKAEAKPSIHFSCYRKFQYKIKISNKLKSLFFFHKKALTIATLFKEKNVDTSWT